MDDIKKGKKLAILSYITLIGWILALFMNKDNQNKFALFHIRQALGIHLLYILFSFLISGFNSWMITISFWVCLFILWIYGFLGALQEKWALLPFLGKYFQKWFKNMTA